MKGTTTLKLPLPWLGHQNHLTEIRNSLVRYCKPKKISVRLTPVLLRGPKFVSFSPRTAALERPKTHSDLMDIILTFADAPRPSDADAEHKRQAQLMAAIERSLEHQHEQALQRYESNEVRNRRLTPTQHREAALVAAGLSDGLVHLSTKSIIFTIPDWLYPLTPEEEAGGLPWKLEQLPAAHQRIPSKAMRTAVQHLRRRVGILSGKSKVRTNVFPHSDNSVYISITCAPTTGKFPKVFIKRILPEIAGILGKSKQEALTQSID